MRVAVLTLCRDRLLYTRHCFRLLGKQNVEFHHYVMDQGSTDGTADWLRSYRPHFVSFQPNNIGISRGLNHLLDSLDEDYDVIVKIDNDAELPRVDTLREVCEAVLEHHGWLLSPRIEGLRSPPTVTREYLFPNGRRIGQTDMIGGIFLAAPGYVYKHFRYDEDNPPWGMDDVGICQWGKANGFATGYLLDHVANHYPTTDRQHEDYGWYFERRVAEGGPV